MGNKPLTKLRQADLDSIQRETTFSEAEIGGWSIDRSSRVEIEWHRSRGMVQIFPQRLSQWPTDLWWIQEDLRSILSRWRFIELCRTCLSTFRYRWKSTNLIPRIYRCAGRLIERKFRRETQLGVRSLRYERRWIHHQRRNVGNCHCTNQHDGRRIEPIEFLFLVDLQDGWNSDATTWRWIDAWETDE